MNSQYSGAQLELELESQPTSGRYTDSDNLIAWLRCLRAAYLAGYFGGTVHEVYPDVPAGSRENYLYFTLAPALNFQRSSEGLWRAALATYQDTETRFVFFPEKTVATDFETFKRALVTHRLALQPQKHSEIWYRISCTLHERFESDPRALLRSQNHDVVQVKSYIQAHKRDFPYLSGPKLLNYWLYMLLSFTDARLSSREEISIIPDLHVCRATERLGLVPAGTDSTPEQVAARWRELLTGSDIAPCELHGPLWRWSRSNFRELPRAH
ncbi:MAG: hypothetical protein GEV03_23955 [Streptosporangiales bacterium]|nr:hypothetical protein [Streptosporangiales bacterium]